MSTLLEFLLSNDFTVGLISGGIFGGVSAFALGWFLGPWINAADARRAARKARRPHRDLSLQTLPTLRHPPKS